MVSCCTHKSPVFGHLKCNQTPSRQRNTTIEEWGRGDISPPTAYPIVQILSLSQSSIAVGGTVFNESPIEIENSFTVIGYTWRACPPLLNMDTVSHGPISL